jgi:hypothetical protein
MNKLKLEMPLRADGHPLPQDAVVEVSVLLESRLLSLLTSAANGHGMTAGSLVRRLIRDFLDGFQGAPPAFYEPADPPHPKDAIV